MSFTSWVICSGLLGLSVGVMDYVPIAIYCMHVSRRTGDYGLYVSSIYSFAYVVGAITSYTYGQLRKTSEEMAFKVEMIVACTCLLSCSLCLSLHIRRNWDGALFKYVKT